MKIINQAFRLLYLIAAEGYFSKIVGGAVRNFLLKKEIDDIDIATTATPDQIKAIANRYGWKYLALGQAYGSCRLFFRRNMYEITTLRDEPNGYQDIRFTDSFEVDSRRRDFSINAIYMDYRGNFFDYHNGIKDLKNRYIRFIGDPDTRIKQDPLRLLRYIRFTALYGNYEINVPLVMRNIQQLELIQNNKVTKEMLKILSVKNIDYLMPVLHPIFEILYSADIRKIPQKPTGKESLYEIIKASRFPELMIEKYGFSRSKILSKNN